MGLKSNGWPPALPANKYLTRVEVTESDKDIWQKYCSKMFYSTGPSGLYNKHIMILIWQSS